VNQKQRMIDKAMDDFNKGLIEKETYIEKMQTIEKLDEHALFYREKVDHYHNLFREQDKQRSNHTTDALGYLSTGNRIWNARCIPIDPSSLMSEDKIKDDDVFHDIGDRLNENYVFCYYKAVPEIIWKRLIGTERAWVLRPFENCHRWELATLPAENMIRSGAYHIERVTALKRIKKISDKDIWDLRKKYWWLIVKIIGNILYIIAAGFVLYYLVTKILLLH